jgi:hypothetical protein
MARTGTGMIASVLWYGVERDVLGSAHKTIMGRVVHD